MLILDDVHLLESPLRALFTVSVRRGETLYDEVLRRVVSRCPYYSLADDLLNGVEPLRPPEMLVFPDSAELADEVRDLLDAGLADGSEPWWAWQRVRDRPRSRSDAARARPDIAGSRHTLRRAPDQRTVATTSLDVRCVALF